VHSFFFTLHARVQLDSNITIVCSTARIVVATTPNTLLPGNNNIQKRHETYLFTRSKQKVFMK